MRHELGGEAKQQQYKYKAVVVSVKPLFFFYTLVG